MPYKVAAACRQVLKISDMQLNTAEKKEIWVLKELWELMFTEGRKIFWPGGSERASLLISYKYLLYVSMDSGSCVALFGIRLVLHVSTICASKK